MSIRFTFLLVVKVTTTHPAKSIKQTSMRWEPNTAECSGFERLQIDKNSSLKNREEKHTTAILW
jgi:hypothetical protein